MTSKGLIFSSRATTGREGKYVSRHMCILKSQCEILDHLNTGTTKHSKHNIEQFANIKIRESTSEFTQFYLDTLGKFKNWAELYTALDVSNLKQYAHLYLMAGIDLHNSDMTRFGKMVEIFPISNGQLKFLSHGKIYVNILAMLKAHKEYGIPLHEYQYDTGEIPLSKFHKNYLPENNYVTYHNYDIPEYDVHRMDSLQFYLNDVKTESFFDIDKDIDFTFAYTVLKTSNRQDFPKFVDAIATNFNSTKIFTKNHFTDVDTSIDSDIYTELIKRTKYTMILPAYEKKSFAIDRFITALDSDCLPLLSGKCIINDVESSYDASLTDLLINDVNDVKKFSENNRQELLQYYKDKFLPVRKQLHFTK